MKLFFNYAQMLERQCENVRNAFSGKASNGSSERIFAEICKRLEKDFLPPIDRESIAAMSYELLNVEQKAAMCSKAKQNVTKLIINQLETLYAVTNGLINKKKTCGDDIRRLITANFECSEVIYREGALHDNSLNSSIAEFLKIAQNAYFKNL